MKITWDNVKGLIGKGAPLIGSLIGGPAGGAVASMVASALGVEDTPSAIEAALKGDPDAMVKLKELELTHKTKLEELNLEDTRIRLADTQDARAAEVARMNAGGSNKFMYSLACLVVTSFLAVVFTVLFVQIPEQSEKIVYLMLGILGSEFGSIMRYFFGSSKGSSDKTAMMMKGSK